MVLSHAAPAFTAPTAGSTAERVDGAPHVDPLGRWRPAPTAQAVAPVRVAYCLAGMDAAGGVEMNAVRTAEALDPTEVALTVFAMRADGPMRARYEAMGIAVVQMPPVSTLVGFRTARQAARLARMLRESRVDVVHCHDNYTNWYAGIAARLAGRPLLSSKRWVSADSRHLWMSRVAYHLSAQVLANSRGVAQTLVDVDRVGPGRIVVIPNFVEDDAFVVLPERDQAALRESWGVPLGAPVVGCVARLREEKGHAVLLRAIARLRTAWPNLVLVLVGDGPEEEALRSLAAELGVTDRVCFAGHRPNRPNPNQLFDVSVLVSDHEGFPNSVIEAMAVARPVVASNVGGVPDAVQHEVTGLLTPPRDVEAVADAIGRLLARPEWASRLGAHGQEVARTQFTRAPVMERLTEVYRQLSAGGRTFGGHTSR